MNPLEKMKEELRSIRYPGAEFNSILFGAIQRAMTGAEADIAIKLCGEDVLTELYAKGQRARGGGVSRSPAHRTYLWAGHGTSPQLVVEVRPLKIARYGINIEELNTIIRSAPQHGREELPVRSSRMSAVSIWWCVSSRRKSPSEPRPASVHPHG